MVVVIIVETAGNHISAATTLTQKQGILESRLVKAHGEGGWAELSLEFVGCLAALFLHQYSKRQIMLPPGHLTYLLHNTFAVP